MSSKGIDLLENYVDCTADVQTAAVATVFSMSSIVMKDTRVIEWIEGYAWFEVMFKYSTFQVLSTVMSEKRSGICLSGKVRKEDNDMKYTQKY